jgi:predicted nuclease with RNAse H fold
LTVPRPIADAAALPIVMGVDVGGPRKGFDVAVLSGDRLLALRGRQSVQDVVGLARSCGQTTVAIDSPRSAAPPGATRRQGEKLLRDARVCGIRWTPPADQLHGNPYYGWIVEGLALYGALEGCTFQVIECFPTASWTRWHGPRGSRRRAAWSREAVAALELNGVPPRTNQDQRDAIAAAVTAAAYELGDVESFGEIVVPLPRAGGRR